MPQIEDGAEKNFRPIYTIMPNINEINQRVLILNDNIAICKLKNKKFDLKMKIVCLCP